MSSSPESVVHGSTDATSPPHRPLATPQQLPALDKLLKQAAVSALAAEHGHSLVTAQARDLLAALRQQALAGTLAASDLQPAALASQLQARLQHRLASRLRPVYNLTGTVLHTNLGRSWLPASAVARIADSVQGPSTVEYDLASGGRGDRDHLVETLLCELTGAEAATVVNNNAAAVLLVLTALAHGREVIVSRGELVEIGGSFRMPDVMQSAGARLVEVGATNRTHPRDYASAINPQTALLMKVHTSNYRIEGFTASVAEAELAGIARAHGLPLATDLGSGALLDLSRWSLPQEPTPRQMLDAGCDLVTFSGDKLLGGPQAGFIVGRRALVDRIRRHPMKRALRLGKLLMAAVEATLQLYLRPERLTTELPTLRLLTRPQAEMQALAEQLAPALQEHLQPAYTVRVTPLQSQIGSGSLPEQRLPSAGLAIAPASSQGKGRALSRLASALRALPVPVIGRIQNDHLLLDLRCLENPEAFRAQLSQLDLEPTP